MTEAKTPANIREFNEITGVIFARLYAVFPDLVNLDAKDIAQTLGHSLQDTLESERTVAAVLSLTAGWLSAEGFTRHYGSHALERVCLTTKALAAMNAVPEKLGSSLGLQLTEAAKQGKSEEGKRRLGELVGSFLGSFTGSGAKAIGGG
jgi:hypothetical protein